MSDLATMIAQAVRTQLQAERQRNPPDPPVVTPPPVGDDRPDRGWTPEEIGFFDPEAEGTDPVVNAGKHVFYRDVFAFVDRLKDMAPLKGPEKLRTVLPQCLRGAALIWHSTELTDLEKSMIREASLDM